MSILSKKKFRLTKFSLSTIKVVGKVQQNKGHENPYNIFSFQNNHGEIVINSRLK